jgi:23S rRNA (adenine2503-C2)-methyltransferase
VTEPLAHLHTPLSLPSAAFVEAERGRVRFRVGGETLGGRSAAIAAYRAYHREGLGFGGAIAPAYAVSGVLREESSEGEVVKFLTRVPGVPERGMEWLEVESVLIPMMGKRERNYTLCVSSQVGCAMGCTFCETGRMGLLRSLSRGEIVAQWWNAKHAVADGAGRVGAYNVRNIVFMGMGEPMDNLEEVIGAIDVLRDHNGPGLAASKITISTVGRVDGIRRLMEKVREPGWRKLGLALSLNAPNDADRSAIMPVNRKYALADVQAALVEWPLHSCGKICVEYVLIPGVNDSERHAEEIAAFMKPFGLCVGGRIGGNDLAAVLNLIPYNPRRESPWPAPTEERVEAFLGWLIARGVFVKRRRTKGRGLMGACGQLGSERIRGRKLVTPTVSGV